MKSRFFWRLLALFAAALLIAVGISSFLMVTLVRAERQEALEQEVLVQARDIGILLGQQDLSMFSGFPMEPSISAAAAQKIISVRKQYGCTIWVVYANGRAYTVSNDAVVSSEQLSSESTMKQLYSILSGEEIRARGLYKDDSSIVTLGVPWRNASGRVEGAIMLHLSLADLEVDYSDMLRNVMISALAALIAGGLASFFIAGAQTRSLRRISEGVADFAAGKLDTRIELTEKGDLRHLADTFNAMAADLANLEESRRSFVASVSHELRSPLTCIRGYIESMQDGTIPPEEQGPYLEIVLKETDRLSGLVNDLLDLSRIESGKVPLDRKNFDINELTRIALLKFEPRIDAKKINVDVQMRDTPVMVNADAGRITQVLTNLIDNAIKFLREDGLLTLSVRESGRKCYVSVRDNGPGIAQEDLPYIFDRFYKADKAHTAGMGTGLGLAIVHKILEQHGETIQVNSSGSGTEFVFTLPLADDTQNKKEQSENESI